MEFTIVDVPTTGNVSNNSEMTQICDALAANVGKALQIPCVDANKKPVRDPNTLRKSIRAALRVRGILGAHAFRTQIVGNDLKVWLIVNPNGETEEIKEETEI